MELPALLNPGDDFPPSEQALSDPNGLIAIGGSLDEVSLVKAYRRGIFPWFEEPQPILWWTPDPRSVLFTDEIHVSRSLKRSMRRLNYRLSADTAFSEVMAACAEPRPGQAGTWIGVSMRRAYERLHRAGFAHSIEVREKSDRLIGGLYGVAVGACFFGESMFSRANDGSKIALLALIELLKRQNIPMVDCQVESEHLNSLGARCIDRVDFERRLEQTASKSAKASWDTVSDCQSLLLHV
ncbi:MAG: leucyl/phenylalanyl-tRNA--protein transferase [Pseudomonadota bacterium]